MIEISGLTLRYGRRKALDNLSFRAERGESILLAGANGSGKTSLLRVLAGVLNSRRTEVRVFDRGVSPQTRRRTAYIASGVPFYDHLRLGEAVRLHGSFFSPFAYRGIAGHEFDLGLRVGSLSKGEKTLFLLSLALSAAPELLLIDDVVHFLDPHLRDVFVRAILRLIAEEKLTVVIASQSASDIEGLPERIVLLERGRIVLDAPTDSLKQSMVRVYLKDIPPGLPAVFCRDWEGMKEVYVYPFSPGLPVGDAVEHLGLPDILRAFIGGEYDRR